MQTFTRVSLVVLVFALIFAVMVAQKLPDQMVKVAQLDYEVQSPEENLLDHQKAILEDRFALERIPFFRGSKGEKDAGPFLNPLVPWERDRKSSLVLSEELTKKLNDHDWVALNLDFDALKLDFSWMKKLQDYDYWAPDFNNPRIKIEERPGLSQLPFPDYRILTNWGKLRLIHGRKTKTMPQALKEVRQLARLIYTNDFLVSSVVSIAMLRNEAAFVKAYNPKIFEGWQTIPEEDLVRAKRYFWAMPLFVDPRLTLETYERLSAGNVGQCQMISEGMMPNLILRDHLHKVYPAILRRFDQTVMRSLENCRQALAHVIWTDHSWKALGSHPDYEESLVKPENESEWKWKFLMIHPRVEQYHAFFLLSVAGPDYLKFYREPGRF